MYSSGILGKEDRCLGGMTFFAQSHPSEVCGSNGLPLTPNSITIYGKSQYLKSIEHDNLSRYLDIIRSKHERIVIVAEYSGTPLVNKIITSIDDIITIAYKTLLGLSYIHDVGLVHRHLSPENILIKENGDVQLYNYGLYYMTDCGKNVQFPIGCPKYTAPEVFLSNSNDKSSCKVDCWSLGMIIAELLLGKCIWSGTKLHQCLWKLMSLLKSQNSIFEHLARECNEYEKFQKLSPSVKHFVDSCLQVRVSQRKTSKELLNLELFQKFSVNNENNPVDDNLICNNNYHNHQNNNSNSNDNKNTIYRRMDELYHLWQLAGGDMTLELKKNGLIRSRPPILSIPNLIILLGQMFGRRDTASLLDLRVIRVPLDTLRQRLCHIPYIANCPRLTNQMHVKVQDDFTDTSSQLPLIIRERDTEYQFYRIVLFDRLLKIYPITRMAIIREAHKDVPPLLRGKIWAALLGVTGDYTKVYDSIDKETPTHTDRQIEVDIPRCHQYSELLSSGAGHERLQRLLKAWVRDNPHYVYWQGLDSLTAPFLYLNFNNEPRAYACLSAFIPKYLHKFFLKDNSAVIQEYLSKFSQIIAFHDPHLANHLRSINFVPELFAIPWFLTMFSHVFPLYKILHLWDKLLLGDSSFPLMVGLAILKQLRDCLLQSGFNECILLFSDLPEVDIELCVQDSMDMYENTPSSITYRKHQFDQSKASHWQEPEPGTEKLPRISIDDYIHLLEQNNNNVNSVVTTVDIRNSTQFERGAVVESINIPFANVQLSQTDINTLGPQATIFAEQHKNTVVIIGPHDQNNALFAEFLIKCGIARVCSLQGGIYKLRSKHPQLLVSTREYLRERRAMQDLDASLRDWVRKYVKERFTNSIEHKLNEREKEINKILNSTKVITQLHVSEIIKTEEIHKIIEIVKDMKRKKECYKESTMSSGMEQSLSSFRDNDDSMTLEDWCPSLRPHTDLSMIFDEIAKNKPVHVRLAGFETLANTDLSNNCNNDGFKILLNLLKDGISDNTKSVFESSLRIHSKLLESPRSHEVYTNLINIFEAEYYSEKQTNEYSLPNFSTGVNFKIIIHEKLIRLLYVILKHHKELLKITRNIDGLMEEMIDQFIVLLTWDDDSSKPVRSVSTLHLLSLLEPHANWSEKWLHSVSTMRTFIAAVAKSPNLLQKIYGIVRKGLENPMLNSSFAYTIKDNVAQSNYRSVFVSGDTIEVITYLHCLNFVSQINNCLSGSASLCSIELPLSPNDFLLTLVNSLNSLATSTIPNCVYNTCQCVLRSIINQPKFSFESNFLNVALTPLFKFIYENDGNLSPHTMDLINSILDSEDASVFINHQHVQSTLDEANKNGDAKVPVPDPVTALLDYTSIVLRQPIAVIDIDHVVTTLDAVGKLFCVLENFETIYEALENQLYPSIEYFFNKIQKYSVGQENSTQQLDSAIKDMLVKIVSWPLGLQLLSGYPAVFDELVGSSINPFRYPWSSSEIISFVSSVTYFDSACQVVSELIPDTLALLLSQLSQDIETFEFMDLSDCQTLVKFIHMLSLFSLNTKCFIIFMVDRLEKDVIQNYGNYPQNLVELFEHSAIIDSPFHYLSLFSLETVIWNLDILIYILKAYNLQSKLLNLQNYNLIKVTKYKEKIESNQSDYGDDNAEETDDEEKHTVYVIDETSMLRSLILSKSYFIRHKLKNAEDDRNPERCTLYSNFPPPTPDHVGEFTVINSEDSSELDELLQDCRPGLRDSGWLMQIRNAHKNSKNPITHSTLLNLLNQMERAISPVEWVDRFKWINSPESDYNWLPEEDIALDLVIRFAEDHCENIDDEGKVKDNLKQVLQSVHKFIKYERKPYFEGFDWFLGTIFVVCDGNINRCKTFVKNFVRFPSAIYMWYMHGMSFNANNEQKLATQFLVAQQINLVVIQEFSAVNYALQTEFGIKWWMLCNRMLAQCFWGVLEWSEIVNFLALCILNPPDYIVYYCASLLKHSESIIMQDIIDDKLWPENMDFSSYHCHNYITFMDKLAKKYRNKILPLLVQNESPSLDEE